MVKDLYISSQQQKIAELKALQAQINPHFIYNTLDSINWVALCNNETQIASMVSSLASIMRYSIKNPEQMVALREEIEHVENYVNIQAMRYDNNFDMKLEVSSQLLDFKVPKFIIQPLVENSIVHGTEKTKNRGLISITVSEIDDKVMICVDDNGSGANIEELNKYLEGEKTLLQDSDGFGIKNIDQRIKLVYGEKYGLFYHSNSDSGVTATIQLPQKQDS